MKYIPIIIAFLCATAVVAQNDTSDKKDRHAKIQALKVAHLTEQLNLTAEEAQKFWPIYNEYEEKMHDLRRSERKEVIGKIKNDLETMSDEEANKLIKKGIELRSKEVSTYRMLIENLKGIIPPKKILLLRKAEEDFKRKLLERYKNKKGKK